MRQIKLIALLISTLLVAACESDNEHFCARYNYVFSQLLEDQQQLPSYIEMRQQLEQDLRNPKKKKEQVQFMLFILEEWQMGILPKGESPQDFCLRTQRWKAYPYTSD